LAQFSHRPFQKCNAPGVITVDARGVVNDWASLCYRIEGHSSMLGTNELGGLRHPGRG
jgi:hypothetical protein